MLRTATLSLALTLGLTTSALAQDPMGAPEAAPMDPAATTGTDMAAAGGDASTYLGRSVLNSAGQIRVDAFVIAGLNKGAAFEPVSISPDIYYGVSDQLQIGIVHTTPLRWQQPGFVGTSLCVTGEDKGCNKVYDNVGLDGQFSLLQGPTDLAAQGTLYLNSFDPATLALAIGVNGKHRFSEMLGLAFNPQIQIGLTERDAGNEEVLFVPVELQLQIIPPVAFMLQTALYSSFENFGDSYVIPVGIAGMLNVTPMIDLGVRFAFDNLLGKMPSGANRGDFRTLSLLAQFRL